jgi:alpha-glucosidase (family GH31 glycosyl hydrolase)
MQNLDLECFIYTGTPSEILKNQARLSGFPVLPPDWAFGPWMSSNEWNSQERVLKELHTGRELDIPATVLVIEAWSDEKNFYIWNDARYNVKDGADHFCYSDFTFPSDGLWPSPRAMSEDIHSDDTKLILWQIPVLKKLEEDVTCEQNARDRQYMIEKNFCVMDGNGRPYKVKPWWFTGSLVIDFTSKEATEWWLRKREYLIDEMGIDGFKTDGGEHLWGRELSFFDGRTGSELWNDYPKLYINSYFKFINNKNGGITFSRSGFMGVQASPVHWAGDQDSTWDAHRSVLKAVLNTGISGIPFMGWDIGGFSGEIPTAELYLRSTAFACFGSIMQYHSEFYDHRTPHVDRTPWNIADRTGFPEVIDIYRYFAKLRMLLIPYIKKEAEHCTISGEPLMRAMFIDYPDDPICWKLEDQYKFGHDLVVCPVMYEGQEEREVYLPEGEWYDFFTGERYAGRQKYFLKVPLNRIPVFRKKSALLDNIALPEEVIL